MACLPQMKGPWVFYIVVPSGWEFSRTDTFFSNMLILQRDLHAPSPSRTGVIQPACWLRPVEPYDLGPQTWGFSNWIDPVWVRGRWAHRAWDPAATATASTAFPQSGMGRVLFWAAGEFCQQSLSPAAIGTSTGYDHSSCASTGKSGAMGAIPLQLLEKRVTAAGSYHPPVTHQFSDPSWVSVAHSLKRLLIPVLRGLFGELVKLWGLEPVGSVKLQGYCSRLSF